MGKWDIFKRNEYKTLSIFLNVLHIILFIHGMMYWTFYILFS